MNARELVDAYVERANAGNVRGLLELFADDAVLAHMLGAFAGREEVRRFYEEVVFPTDPVISVTSFEETEDGCRVVFSATTDAFPGHVLEVTDEMGLNPEGKIRRLVISTKLPRP